jgi:hypothetical protein
MPGSAVPVCPDRAASGSCDLTAATHDDLRTNTRKTVDRSGQRVGPFQAFDLKTAGAAIVATVVLGATTPLLLPQMGGRGSRGRK